MGGAVAERSDRVLMLGGCGYIGSRIVPFLRGRGATVTVVDLCLRGDPGGYCDLQMDYRDVPRALLAEYSTIILLAGHSSVGQAVRDPHGAFRNNVVGLYDLMDRLDGQSFIYATTSSVYDGAGAEQVDEQHATFLPRNMYDLSKYVGDALLTIARPNAVGLRLGTVVGASPNMRNDLMLNAMVQSAQETGVVRVFNPGVHRPILALSDLERAVGVLVEDGHRPSGLYNLCSFNTTPLDVGRFIAREVGATLEIADETTETYDFSMDTTRFSNDLGFTFAGTAQSVVGELLTALWSGQ
jgi:nucleoside-diphosphate-sugar epimerase